MILPEVGYAVKAVDGLVLPACAVRIDIGGKSALGILYPEFNRLDVLILVSFDQVVVDVKYRVKQWRPAEIANVGVGARPFVEVVVSARFERVA